jgi:hypothetical protein
MITLREALMLTGLAAAVAAIPLLVMLDQRGPSSDSSQPAAETCVAGPIAAASPSSCPPSVPEALPGPAAQLPDFHVERAPPHAWTDPDTPRPEPGPEIAVADAGAADEPARTGGLQSPQMADSGPPAESAPTLDVTTEPEKSGESSTPAAAVQAPADDAAPAIDRRVASLPPPISDASPDRADPPAEFTLPPSRPATAPKAIDLPTKPSDPTVSGAAKPATPEEESRALAVGYLGSWSSDNETALRSIRSLFGPRVTYFGRSLDREAILDVKKRFAERWPSRSYRHRPGSMTVRCEAYLCRVRSIVDWETANPGRKARSRGALRFELGVDVSGARPVVKSEKSVEIANLEAKPSRVEPSILADRGRAQRQVAKRPPLQLPGALLPDDTVEEDGSDDILLPEN